MINHQLFLKASLYLLLPNTASTAVDFFSKASPLRGGSRSQDKSYTALFAYTIIFFPWGWHCWCTVYHRGWASLNLPCALFFCVILFLHKFLAFLLVLSWNPKTLFLFILLSNCFLLVSIPDPRGALICCQLFYTAIFVLFLSRFFYCVVTSLKCLVTLSCLIV